jgi:hypothetical protein
MALPTRREDATPIAPRICVTKTAPPGWAERTAGTKPASMAAQHKTKHQQLRRRIFRRPAIVSALFIVPLACFAAGKHDYSTSPEHSDHGMRAIRIMIFSRRCRSRATEREGRVAAGGAHLAQTVSDLWGVEGRSVNEGKT